MEEVKENKKVLPFCSFRNS